MDTTALGPKIKVLEQEPFDWDDIPKDDEPIDESRLMAASRRWSELMKDPEPPELPLMDEPPELLPDLLPPKDDSGPI